MYKRFEELKKRRNSCSRLLSKISNKPKRNKLCNCNVSMLLWLSSTMRTKNYLRESIKHSRCSSMIFLASPMAIILVTKISKAKQSPKLSSLKLHNPKTCFLWTTVKAQLKRSRSTRWLLPSLWLFFASLSSWFSGWLSFKWCTKISRQQNKKKQNKMELKCQPATKL